MAQKNFGPKKILGPNSKKNWVSNFLRKCENVLVRIFVLKNFGSAIFFKYKFEKNCGVEKIFGSEKNFGSEMCAPQIFFGPKKFWPKKILDQKKFCIRKFWKNILDPKRKC